MVCYRLLRRLVWVSVLPVCRLAYALLTSATTVITSLLQAATVSTCDDSQVYEGTRIVAVRMRFSPRSFQEDVL